MRTYVHGTHWTPRHGPACRWCPRCRSAPPTAYTGTPPSVATPTEPRAGTGRCGCRTDPEIPIAYSHSQSPLFTIWSFCRSRFIANCSLISVTCMCFIRPDNSVTISSTWKTSRNSMTELQAMMWWAFGFWIAIICSSAWICAVIAC